MRISKDVQIKEKNRDENKWFKITEMAAYQTEKWATAAINAIIRNSTDEKIETFMPILSTYIHFLNQTRDFSKNEKEFVKEIANKNGFSLADSAFYLGYIFAKEIFRLPNIEYSEIMDPLLSCCSYYVNYTQDSNQTLPVNNETIYIEEPITFMILKKEAFTLHANFMASALLQTYQKLRL